MSDAFQNRFCGTKLAGAVIGIPDHPSIECERGYNIHVTITVQIGCFDMYGPPVLRSEPLGLTELRTSWSVAPNQEKR